MPVRVPAQALVQERADAALAAAMSVCGEKKGKLEGRQERERERAAGANIGWFLAVAAAIRRRQEIIGGAAIVRLAALLLNTQYRVERHK